MKKILVLLLVISLSTGSVISFAADFGDTKVEYSYIRENEMRNAITNLKKLKLMFEIFSEVSGSVITIKPDDNAYATVGGILASVGTSEIKSILEDENPELGDAFKAYEIQDLINNPPESEQEVIGALYEYVDIVGLFASSIAYDIQNDIDFYSNALSNYPDKTLFLLKYEIEYRKNDIFATPQPGWFVIDQEIYDVY